ncbi:MAG: SHOCT domain-containing protein [Anaerolineae bacterium]|nr:SHOCT domain-containing protein [Anaerolineae bacterium]
MMRAGLGCLLMIAAMVLLFALVVIPVIPQTADNSTIDNYLKAILCQPTDRLIRDQYSYYDYDSDGGGTAFSMNVYCENTAEQREDVTGKWTLISIGAFLAPFLLGLLLFIVGITRRAMKATQQIGNLVTARSFGGSPQVMVTRYGSSSSPIEGLDINEGVLKVGGMEIPLNNSSAQQVETFSRPTGQAAPGETTLAARLRQLQEARDAGLISMDEYDRVRKEILDNMG